MEKPVNEVMPGVRKKEKKRAKRRFSWLDILLTLVFIAGVALLLYPTASNMNNTAQASRTIDSYSRSADDLMAEERLAIIEAAEAYNSALPPGANFELDDEALAVYESLLNPTGNGVMGYVQIPAINVNLPVFHGTDESVLRNSVGHLAGSSLPVGGEGSHCVLTGHRGLPSARLFTDLNKVVVGNTFSITVLDKTLTYMVDQITVVLPEEIDDLAIEEGKDYCTLVTCTPYGVNTHRMLSRGVRVEDEDTAPVSTEAVRISNLPVLFGIGIPVLFILLVVVFISYSIKKPRKTNEEMLDEFKRS